MSFLLYPRRERAVHPDGTPLLWRLGPYVAVFQRLEVGATGALLARRVDADGGEHGDVLIHQLPTGSAAVGGAADLFREEWRRATHLSHPNILRTLDTWLDTAPNAEEPAPPPLFFQLVTESVPGEMLATVLAALDAKGARLPVPLALWVAAQVAHGLHAAHEATDARGQPLEVLHRDVAPSHVLLAYDGGVKLSGFGIACAAVKLTGGPIFKHMGSQPPETFRKGGGPVDRRADVYGLGVTLYEALTGVDPFRRPVDFDSLKAAMSADAPPPSRHRPELPPTVDAVVMRAMAPRAEDRYATAAELARALEALRGAFTREDGREELATFLGDLFGEERIRTRTHVPPLAELRARAEALQALEALPSASEGRWHDDAPALAPDAGTRFMPHSRLLLLYGGFLMFILAGVVANVAKARERFVEEVNEVARGGQARAVSCLAGAAGERVRVLLQLDGQGHAQAKVEGALAGTVAARCIEDALAGLPWPRKQGLPVTVEVPLDGR